MSLFDIAIQRQTGSSGEETFWLVNNAPGEPIMYKFANDLDSLKRFQNMMEADDLGVLLNAIGDDTQPILADATGQVISGEQAAFSFWNDNLANAKTIEGVGFQVQEAAFEIAEDVLLEDELAEAAQWLALFLL